MTWQSLFDLSTMDHRHIVAAYATIILVNIAVFARLTYAWTHPKP
jgi:hypothetical protein